MIERCKKELLGCIKGGEKRPLNQFFSSAKVKLIVMILTFEKFPIFGLVNSNFYSFC